MKRLLTITILLLIGVGVRAERLPRVVISDITISENERNVTVKFIASVPKMGSDYKLTIRPTLHHGKDSKLLTPIMVSGRNKSISDQRSDQFLPVGVMGEINQSIPYSIVVPYESWMDEVSLRADLILEGCCNKRSLIPMNLVASRLIHYDLKPVFDAAPIEPVLSALQKYDEAAPFLYPAQDYAIRHEIFEQQREKGALIIHFEQGKSTIDPAFRDNRSVLTSVNKVLDLIEADPNASLKKIVIVGLTSPEGSLLKNDILAEKRANSLKYFVGERIEYDPSMFDIIVGSEDWDGLRRLVQASNMPDRALVLKTMDSYPIDGGREVALMKLKGGRPYRYMMEHFFPDLRNAGYLQLYYERTPDREVELMNQGIALVEGHQYKQALTVLLQVNDKQRVANAIGVCYMMTGDYSQAVEYFEQAIAAGSTEALENMNRLKIAKSIK